MAQQTINIGSSANDGTGDPLRTAFDKINDNFTELYGSSPFGTIISLSGNTISTNQSNADLVLRGNGTGGVVADSIKFSGTTISSDDSTSIQVNENFDVEVFEFDNNDPDKLIRKNFDKDYKSLNGEMITEDYIKNVQKTTARDHGPSDVAYYFDVLKDEEVDNEAACKGAEIYNKNSYYIDLDFECTTDTDTSTAYYDIYGPVTEPEICQ